MTPEQFVEWLGAYIAPAVDFGGPDETVKVSHIAETLATVVLKAQPPQPGVLGVLGQGLMRLEKATDVAWASVDPTEVRVFNGGGCQ